MRIRTDPAMQTTVNTDTDDDVDTSKVQSSVSAVRSSGAHHRHHRHSNSAPKITRTNTYAGRSENRQRAPADFNISLNMAETRPIMPQQYQHRPNHPPPYMEAIERKEKNKTTPVPEIERSKQTVNSARAKQLYAKSLQMFEQENNQSHPASVTTSKSDSRSTSSTTTSSSKLLTDIHDNNNTIGIVKTDDKKIVIKRASSTKTPRHNINKEHSNIFYQPDNNGGHNSKPISMLSVNRGSNQSSSIFYRPTQPPPYKEALKQRTVKPDLIDSLGGESLV